MAHAKLKAAEENSGKLVSLVREKARLLAKEKDAGLLIIDGPPGIGCPVIASVGGVNAALIVTEPTMSGMHDLKRVSKLTGHFKIPTYVAINKYDLNPDISDEIEKVSKSKGLRVVGKIPYDLEVTEALLEKKSIVEYSGGKITQEIKNIWNRLVEELNKEEK
jgi:MinD superfamily P-loop ATPase